MANVAIRLNSQYLANFQVNIASKQSKFFLGEPTIWTYDTLENAGDTIWSHAPYN